MRSTNAGSFTKNGSGLHLRPHASITKTEGHPSDWRCFSRTVQETFPAERCSAKSHRERWRLQPLPGNWCTSWTDEHMSCIAFSCFNPIIVQLLLKGYFTAIALCWMVSPELSVCVKCSWIPFSWCRALEKANMIECPIPSLTYRSTPPHRHPINYLKCTYLLVMNASYTWNTHNFSSETLSKRPMTGIRS